MQSELKKYPPDHHYHSHVVKLVDFCERATWLPRGDKTPKIKNNKTFKEKEKGEVAYLVLTFSNEGCLFNYMRD